MHCDFVMTVYNYNIDENLTPVLLSAMRRPTCFMSHLLVLVLVSVSTELVLVLVLTVPVLVFILVLLHWVV